MDLGAGRRGVDMGPSALRVAGLNQKLAELGYQIEDLGNVLVDQPESAPAGPTHARYLSQIAHTCARLAEMVERAADKGHVPLVLGGDHSVAIGTVAGVSRHLRKQAHKLGVLWIDAHADMNTPESSPSGNIHGMPLACILGKGPSELTGIGSHVPMVDPQNVAIVGLRSVDDIERLNVRGAGVHPFTMRDIDERGMRTVMQEAIHNAGGDSRGLRRHRWISSLLRP
jgi:arginase